MMHLQVERKGTSIEGLMHRDRVSRLWLLLGKNCDDSMVDRTCLRPSMS